MSVYYDHLGISIHVGDCLNIMPTLYADSVDAVVTDPPYHLTSTNRGSTPGSVAASKDVFARVKSGGFMGKAWDGGDVAFRVETWREVFRVMKPGAHLVAFGGTRTFHRLTCAIEDAGFEIRDCLSWLYGSGFPKSLDVSKAMDKAAGAERAVVGVDSSKLRPNKQNFAKRTDRQPDNGAAEGWKDNGATITAPATDAAREWDGWGTALKPAWEPIILARKPLRGTVAANVLEHGTGALNVDGCRIAGESTERTRTPGDFGIVNDDGWEPIPGTNGSTKGRWPANVVLDEDAATALDEQTGERASGNMMPTHTDAARNTFGQNAAGGYVTMETYGDTGGASRFFYTAKASKADRFSEAKGGNDHPTVKPLDLMQWLVTLVTPPGGIVLDPFMGSGSTLKAAKVLNLRAIGIDLEERHAEIAAKRLSQEVLALG